jgi:hypothetical protein
MKKCIFLVALWLITNGLNAAPETNRVGNISVPSGVTMTSFSTSKPNYQMGKFGVRITALPESTIDVIRYVWIEDFQRGLKPAVDRLKVLPTVVFDDVSENDAKRMLANLKALGCEADITRSREDKYQMP